MTQVAALIYFLFLNLNHHHHSLLCSCFAFALVPWQLCLLRILNLLQLKCKFCMHTRPHCLSSWVSFSLYSAFFPLIAFGMKHKDTTNGPHLPLHYTSTSMRLTRHNRLREMSICCPSSIPRPNTYRHTHTHILHWNSIRLDEHIEPYMRIRPKLLLLNISTQHERRRLFRRALAFGIDWKTNNISLSPHTRMSIIPFSRSFRYNFIAYRNHNQ